MLISVKINFKKSRNSYNTTAKCTYNKTTLREIDSATQLHLFYNHFYLAKLVSKEIFGGKSVKTVKIVTLKIATWFCNVKILLKKT